MGELQEALTRIRRQASDDIDILYGVTELIESSTAAKQAVGETQDAQVYALAAIVKQLIDNTESIYYIAGKALGLYDYSATEE